MALKFRFGAGTSEWSGLESAARAEGALRGEGGHCSVNSGML